jgi:hypothetical protein
MAGGTLRSKASPVHFSSFVDELTAVPRNFLLGWLMGMLVPLVGLAATVAGVYLYTNKVPFVTGVDEEDGQRRLTVALVEPKQAQERLRQGREALVAFGDEVRGELETEEQ